MLKSRKSVRIQHNPGAEEAKENSASVEDLETAGCFLADQVIGQLPKTQQC